MSQICPKCQSENIDDAKFCTSCGSEITQAISSEPIEPVIDDKPIEQPQVESPQKTQPEIKKSISYKKFGFIALVLLLVAGIGGYVWYNQQPSEYLEGDLEKRSGVWYEKGSDDLAYGVMKKYYKSGELKLVAQYIDGKIEGDGKLYYKSGKLKSINPFVNGLGHGLQKNYYENGKLESTYPRDNDKLSGIAKHYDEETGELKAKLPYIDNKLNGIAQYFLDGKLFQEVQYANNEKNGIGKIYGFNNNLQTLTTYQNDKKNGISIEYKNGAMYKSTIYKDDVIVSGFYYNHDGSSTKMSDETIAIIMSSDAFVTSVVQGTAQEENEE